MAKKATTSSFTAKKQKRSQCDNFQQGQADGDYWTATADALDVKALLDRVGWHAPDFQPPWIQVPFSNLRSTMEAQGKAYTVGFIQSVRVAGKSVYRSVASVSYQEDIEDGSRWASDFANPHQWELTYQYSKSFDSVLDYIDTSLCGSWTPAHRFLSFLMEGRYPANADYDELIDCQEFRDIWQPFVALPMPQVMADLECLGVLAGHKLQDQSYIVGFIDGVLGLSKRLTTRLTIQKPILLSKDGRTYND